MAITGWILLSSLVAILNLHLVKADLPAIFIFGDSTADVGTNNFLNKSLARADYPFNGIDYPFSVATGRFSNGYNTVDMIARLVGYKRSPPPFLALQQQKQRKSSRYRTRLLRGANFASAGAGILYETGRDLFIEIVSFEEQIQQFETVRENITGTLGSKATDTLLSNALYLISIGSNDFFDYQRSIRNHTALPLSTLMAKLNYTFLDQLKNLYNLGARKFVVIGIPPIGCCPVQRYVYFRINGGGDECFDGMNFLAQSFFGLTEAIMREFSSQFPDVKYSLGDTYDMTMTIINNPQTYGFKHVAEACCGDGPFNGAQLCNSTAKLCSDRSEYVFWDWFHPTEAVYNLAAITLYYGENEYVSPVNISRLLLPA